MNQRNLGNSGLQVSVVGLGCNNFGSRVDFEGTRSVVHKALDVGITFFDTADSYGNKGGSESFMGRTLGTRRKDVVLATKFGSAMDEAGRMKGTSRRYIFTAVEASLRRLQTDWIDLYQLHWPDSSTPMEETLRALDDLVHQGKVRYIGCSNLLAWQVADAQWISRSSGLYRFISCQNEYSLLARGIERELIPAMREYRLGLLPYFPLASGLLTGKYKRNQAAPKDSRMGAWPQLGDRYLTERNWQIVESLERFCAERGRTILELAIGWLLANPVTASVIAGATKPEQVEQNARAGQWELTAEEMGEIDRLTSEG